MAMERSSTFNTTETLVRLAGHPRIVFEDIEAILRALPSTNKDDVSDQATSDLPQLSKRVSKMDLGFGFKLSELYRLQNNIVPLFSNRSVMEEAARLILEISRQQEVIRGRNR
jgi:hypothetical protein